MEAQYRVPLYPILFNEKYDRALVIGLGTGVSGRVVHQSGFREIEIAEISPGIAAAAKKHFSRENGFLLDQKNVTLRIEDGRNLLLLNRKPFDLITMEVSSVWFAGAASLYNREFYQLARAKLRPDGVLQHTLKNPNAPSALTYAWIGPFVGAAVRPLGGWISDKLGGSIVTQVISAVMAAA